jgi:hypothetical protein
MLFMINLHSGKLPALLGDSQSLRVPGVEREVPQEKSAPLATKHQALEGRSRKAQGVNPGRVRLERNQALQGRCSLHRPCRAAFLLLAFSQGLRP